ncbi:MAG: ABC transporter permease [Phenylobacterium sp.]
MSLFTEIWAVTAMNVRALPQRLGASLVTVVGVASAVAVMISLLAVGAGLMKTIAKNDQPDRAVVLSANAPAEYMGSFSRADVAAIAQAPGIKRDAEGKPLVQPLATVIVELTKKGDGATANTLFRGTGEQGAKMNKASLKIVEGRRFKAGVHELMAGRAANRQFKDLDVGDQVMLRGTAWKVVGIYEDEGGIDENSIVADADTVLAAFERTSYQSVGVQLDSPASFGKFRDALTSNPQLSVEVKPLTKYYRDQVQGLTAVLNFVGYFVGTVMAVGAVFGALTTMYSAVDARAREIATLRAIGFGGTAVVTSVLTEALLLAVPGALLGVLAAGLVFNGHAVAMGGLSFPLAVTPGLVKLGILWALAIGVIGGLSPAIRAVRLPVATALRAT